MSCEYAFDDGAYVLGALSPGERGRYEQHLAQCPQCRAAVAELAVLPGLLGRLSPDVAMGATEAAGTAERQLPALASAVTAVRRRGRRRTVALALAAACVALFAGFAAGTAPRPAPPPVPVMAAMRPVSDTAVTAEVALTRVTEGTTVRMHCAYPPSDRYTKAYVFRLFALGAGGVAEQIGSWTAGPGDDVVVTGTVRLTLEDILRVELRARDGSPILVYDVPA